MKKPKPFTPVCLPDFAEPPKGPKRKGQMIFLPEDVNAAELTDLIGWLKSECKALKAKRGRA